MEAQATEKPIETPYTKLLAAADAVYETFTLANPHTYTVEMANALKALRAALAEARVFRPTVVVAIDGGCFTGGSSDMPINFILRDFDEIKAPRSDGDWCAVPIEAGGVAEGMILNQEDGHVEVRRKDGNTVRLSDEEFTDAQDPLGGKDCADCGLWFDF